MSGFISINNSQEINLDVSKWKLTEDLKKDLKKNLEQISIKKFTIISNHNNQESFEFSMTIKDFLIKNGFEYNGFLSSTGLAGGDGNPEIILDASAEEFRVFIGLISKAIKEFMITAAYYKGWGNYNKLLLFLLSPM